MSTFNLSDWMQNKQVQSESYVKKYVEAMGYTHQRNRDQYRWWDYEELRSSPPEDWNSWVSSDPSLADVLRDAASYRGKAFQKINQTYGLNVGEASKLVKTYIGYHPAYGGYICQIGPYISKGFWHGQDHIVEQALDKFAYFVIRKRRSTPQEIARSVLKNIASYKDSYNIDFEPSDFSLVVMSPSGEFDPNKKRQSDKEIRDHVESLDPNDPRTKAFFDRSPITGEGSHFSLNSKGYEKLLQQLLGPWYHETLREKAASERKTQRQVAMEILTNGDVLRQVYNQSYQKWQEAMENGEAAAVGMTPPPKFTDKSLRPLSGAQGFTGVPSNELMANQMGLKVQIIRMMQEGLNEPEAISERLNAEPQRQAVNARRQRKGQQPIVITPDEVQRQMDRINRQMQESNKDVGQIMEETAAQVESLREGRGYDDLRTAFEMAAVYFSSQPVDSSTQTMLGDPNAIIFNPPENFENYTSQDLFRLRLEKEAKDSGQTLPTSPEEQATTPEQIAQDIGEKMPESEKVPGTGKQPEAVPQLQKPPAEQHVDLEELLGSTLKNLIKIAEELDAEGRVEAAEEVHKVIRKYAERMI